MGRSSASGWLLYRQLQGAGITPSAFAYSAAREPFSRIRQRLVDRLIDIAGRGDYCLIGHSLGGVLLRAALADLPPSVKRPCRLFLIASPTHSARLARRFAPNWLFRRFTGDCMQLLASESAMSAIPAPTLPTTAIFGSKSFPGWLDQFPGESSDGIVSFSEVDAPWLDQRIEIAEIHTLLPANRKTAQAIIATLRGADQSALT